MHFLPLMRKEEVNILVLLPTTLFVCIHGLVFFRFYGIHPLLCSHSPLVVCLVLVLYWNRFCAHPGSFCHSFSMSDLFVLIPLVCTDFIVKYFFSFILSRLMDALVPAYLKACKCLCFPFKPVP